MELVQLHIAATALERLGKLGSTTSNARFSERFTEK